MKHGWKHCLLGDALTFQRGFDITKKEQQDGPYKVISSSGPKSTHSAYKAKGPGVVIGRKGTLGSVFYTKEDYWPHDTSLWIKDFHGNDPKFAYYFLQTMGLEKLDVGASNPSLNRNHIHIIPVHYPDLHTQRKVAGILSAYDDLIENNLRRIKILEEMAQSLYREWFVHFRFPGYESIQHIDSSLGRIPKRWEVKTIADICQSVSYGFTASASRENIGPKFLRITDIVPDQIDWANVPFCEIPKDKTAKLLLLPGDIVVARTGATTGYAKRLNKLHPDTVFASYLVRARAKTEVSNRMLGILMESDEYKKFIQTNLSGSAQPQANAVVLTSMPLVVPDRAISERFDQIIEPIIDEAELLSMKIQNLRCTRDLLLPQLLTKNHI